MAQMVYIKNVHSGSFLHFSTDKESFCLRDFSPAGGGPAIELLRHSDGNTATTIRTMAKEPGNYLIPITGQKGRGINDYTFWHQQTMKLNAQYLKAQSPSKPALQDRSWLFEHIRQVVFALIVAVFSAIILAWLGLKS